MTDEQQLEWEARASRPVGVAAIAAAILTFAGGAYLQIALSEADESHDFLRLLDAQPSDAYVAAALQAMGILLLIPPLVYLYRATRHRREQLLRLALVLAIAAPLGFAALYVARAVVLTDVAADFADGPRIPGKSEEDRAEDLIEDSSLTAVGGVQLGTGLALGFALILISLNAMRAGLTSRFMGVIGIIVGALYVLPVAGGPQIVQLFWLIALGVLILGRWPGGRGPAWESGKAEPWPTAADQRAMIEAMKGDQPPGNGRAPAAEEGSAETGPERPASRKRKRKKKR